MPGPIGINVGGTRVVRPGIYPRIDASAMVPMSGAPYGNAGVIGPADGGAPGTVYQFASFTEALAVLRGGPALSHLARIFRPSPDLPGASLVRFVRIGAPTRSSLTLNGLVYTSLDYGRHTQGISALVAVGANTPWDVTIRKRSDNYVKTYSVGNAVEVKSTATTPKVVFDHAAKQVKMYENAAVVATLDYPTEGCTLVNLVAFLNSRTGWVAQVKAGGDPSMPICFMDNPVLGSAPAVLTTFTSLPASQGMLIWLLRDRDPHLTADLSVAGTYATLVTSDETYLTSGTGTGNDTFVTSDWTGALAKLESEDVQCIFACTSDSAVQAACHQHCIELRGITRKRWRRFYTGGGANQTVDQAIADVPGFDGPTIYVWNGTTGRNPVTGLQENLGGLGSAAQLCGMRCGSAPCISLTNKPLVAEGLEVPKPSDSDVNRMLTAGVTPIGIDPALGRTVCIQAITAYQGGTNVTYRKEQGLTVNDSLLTGFQVVLADFVGKPMDKITGRLLHGRIAKFLDSVTRTGSNPDGYLTPGQQNGQEIPAWTGLRVEGDGLETWSVFVEAHPVGETAYIPVLCYLTPAPISL